MSENNPPFKKIAIMGREGTDQLCETLNDVTAFLNTQDIDICIETNTALYCDINHLPTANADTLGQHAELLLVIGGDGSLIHAAHTAVSQDLPVLGINRGKLGFLTDIKPDQLESIGSILAGNYQKESRFLIQTQHEKATHIAINEMVLMPGLSAQMVEFDIFIDEQFMCHQRADGLIISTPTGSTAYSLSAGGPILQPSLNDLVLVPMFPHKLNSRPIVLKGDSNITLKISPSAHAPFFSCDGHEPCQINPVHEIIISKAEQSLQLIHPENYDYYNTLRDKLGWEQRHLDQ